MADNRAGHREVDGDVAEKCADRKCADRKCADKKNNVKQRVRTFMIRMQRRRTAVKVVFEGEDRQSDKKKKDRCFEKENHCEIMYFIFCTKSFEFPRLQLFKYLKPQSLTHTSTE